MTGLPPVLQNIVSGIIKEAGASAASSPTVTAAISQAQDQYKKLETVAYVAGAAAALTFIFFVMPRMESPIPRIFRRSRR